MVEKIVEVLSGGGSCSGLQCKPNEVVSSKGVCKSCQDFQVPSRDGRNCIAPRCDPNKEIIRIDGTCEACPSNQVPSSDGRRC